MPATGALTAFENVIAPDDGPPFHTHANEDESWYVIEGLLRFRIGSDLRAAPQGSFVFRTRLRHALRGSSFSSGST